MAYAIKGITHSFYYRLSYLTALSQIVTRIFAFSYSLIFVVCYFIQHHQKLIEKLGVSDST